MLFFIHVKLCGAAAAARADFECHKDGLCTGGWCTGGEILVVEFWSINHESLIFHHVTAFIQCDSKSLLLLKDEILLLLNGGDEKGKDTFFFKIMLTIII